MSVFVDKMLREEKERVLKNGVKKNFIFLATMSRSMFIVLILSLYALNFFSKLPLKVGTKVGDFNLEFLY